MKVYKSKEEVLQDYSTTEELKSLLKEKNIEFHFATKAPEKLAEIYFKNQPLSEAEQGKKESSYFEELANRVKLEEEKAVNTVKRPSVVIFVSPMFNYSLKPVGITKEGKRVRYVKGSTTLDIAEQNRSMDVIPTNYIDFIGISNGEKTFNVDGFIGRSVLRTEDKALIDYLLSHNKYDIDFKIYDKAEMDSREVIKDRKMSQAKYGMYEAPKTELVRVLSFLDHSSTGRDTFNKYYNEESDDTLRKECIKRIEKDLDGFVSAMESKTSKIVHLINLAQKEGIIQVSSDKRNVYWKDSGETIARSSSTSSWQNDVLRYLLETPAGRPALEALEARLSYFV